MILCGVIFSLAVLHPVVSAIISEDSFDTSLFSDDIPSSFDLDAATSVPFDNSIQPLDFADFEAPSLEDELFTDSSANTPLDDNSFTVSTDPLLESSCMTDDSGPLRYFKRDHSICAPGTDATPPFQLKLPDLNDIKASFDDWPTFRGSNIPSVSLPPLSGYSRNDELCPAPRRRLCCVGPLLTLIEGYYQLYYGVNDCKGKIKACEKVPLAALRLS